MLGEDNFLWQWKLHRGSFSSSLFRNKKTVYPQTLTLGGLSYSSALKFTFNFRWCFQILDSLYGLNSHLLHWKDHPFIHPHPIIPIWKRGQVEQPRGDAKSAGLLRMPKRKARRSTDPGITPAEVGETCGGFRFVTGVPLNHHPFCRWDFPWKSWNKPSMVGDPPFVETPM